jgi:hypothetical protein
MVNLGSRLFISLYLEGFATIELVVIIIIVVIRRRHHQQQQGEHPRWVNLTSAYRASQTRRV